LIDEVVNTAKEYGINYDFLLADVLNIEIEQTDLLFIDTLHTYNQLNSELKKHNLKVNKFIILHDTETFGYKDELIYSHASNIVKNISSSKAGLMNAVNDFLQSEDGKNWRIKELFKNNNGLCVLERVA
jgi:predicted RNA-binding protein